MKKIIAPLFIVICISQSFAQVINKKADPVPSPGGGYYDNGYYYQYRNPIPPKPFEFKKQSLISVAISDLAFTNLTIKYEYFKKDGMIGFQVPLSFNLGGIPDSNNYSPSNAGRFLSAKNRIFQTGFNVNYYLMGQQRISPYIGITSQVGAFNYWQYTYTTTTYSNGGYSYNYPSISGRDKNIGTNYGLAFHAGILFNPNETITFNLKAGFGMRRYSTNFTEYTLPFGLAEVAVGFKF